MGARPFERLFEEKIKRQLSKEILFGKLVNGGSATVDVADGEFSITYREPSTSQFEIIAK
jgi:ATP-dependent Clp protease ATP-binding subunit ClpA